jgi:hypothetical protein
MGKFFFSTFYNFTSFSKKLRISTVSPFNLTNPTNLIHFTSVPLRGFNVRRRRVSSFRLFAIKNLKSIMPNGIFTFFGKKIRYIHNNSQVNLLPSISHKNFFSIRNSLKNRTIFFKNLRKGTPHFKINLLKYIYFVTKNETNLILYNYSFLYLTNGFYNNNLIYEMKKNLYSFIYKNEIEKIIIRKYQKVNFIYNLNTDNNFSDNITHNYYSNKNLINTLNNNKSNFLN